MDRIHKRSAKVLIGPNGKMNKTEAAYGEEVLKPKFKAGQILDYKFESITLKLGEGCRYTPDYCVIAEDGTIEMHEGKGFWRDDARVKIKVAASLFPFRFIAVQRKGRVWQYETFTAIQEGSK